MSIEDQIIEVIKGENPCSKCVMDGTRYCTLPNCFIGIKGFIKNYTLEETLANEKYYA